VLRAQPKRGVIGEVELFEENRVEEVAHPPFGEMVAGPA